MTSDRRGSGLRAVLLVAGALLLAGTLVPWAKQSWELAVLQDDVLPSFFPGYLMWSSVVWLGLWVGLGAVGLVASLSQRVGRVVAPYLALAALGVWFTGWSSIARIPLHRAPLDPAVCGSLLVLLLFGAWSRADARLGAPAWSRALGRGLLLAVWIVALAAWSHRVHLIHHLIGAGGLWNWGADGTGGGASADAARISSLVIFGTIGMAVVAATVRVIVGKRGRWIRLTFAVLTGLLILAAPRIWLIPSSVFFTDEAPDFGAEILGLLPAYARVLGLMGFIFAGTVEVLLRLGSRGEGRRIAEQF